MSTFFLVFKLVADTETTENLIDPVEEGLIDPVEEGHGRSRKKRRPKMMDLKD